MHKIHEQYVLEIAAENEHELEVYWSCINRLQTLFQQLTFSVKGTMTSRPIKVASCFATCFSSVYMSSSEQSKEPLPVCSPSNASSKFATDSQILASSVFPHLFRMSYPKLNLHRWPILIALPPSFKTMS